MVGCAAGTQAEERVRSVCAAGRPSAYCIPNLAVQWAAGSPCQALPNSAPHTDARLAPSVIGCSARAPAAANARRRT